MKDVDDIIDREDVPVPETRPFTFTEEAISTATAILAQPSSKDYRAMLMSLSPFVEASDLPGAQLVIEAWISKSSLSELVKFARGNRNDEGVRPVLNWLKDTLTPKGPVTHGVDMTALAEATKAWITENKPVD
jgi:hypothetical protein